MPEPYWTAPTSAEAAPARCGLMPSAPTIELATMNPVAETNTKSGATRPGSPPQPVHAVAADATPANAAMAVPTRSSRSLLVRVTKRALTMFVAMMPTMPRANSTP